MFTVSLCVPKRGPVATSEYYIRKEMKVLLWWKLVMGKALWKSAQEEGHLRLWVQYCRQLVESCNGTNGVNGKKDVSTGVDQIA